MRSYYSAVATAVSLAGLSVVPPTSAASATTVNATDMTASQLSVPNSSHPDSLETASLALFDRGTGHGGHKSKGATTRITPTASISKPRPTTTTKKTPQPTHTAKPDVETAVNAWFDEFQATGKCDPEIAWKTRAKSLMESRNDASSNSRWGNDFGVSMTELTARNRCPDWPADYKKEQTNAMLTVASEMKANNTDTIFQVRALINEKEGRERGAASTYNWSHAAGAAVAAGAGATMALV